MRRDAKHLELRKANPADYNVLRAWLLDRTECLWVTGNNAFSVEDFSRWLEAPDQWGYVLAENEIPRAYGEIWVDEEARDLELAHLIVDPKVRRQGYGKLLIEHLFDVSRQYGMSQVYMRVAPDNRPALACYLSLGFRRIMDLTDGMPTQWTWLIRMHELA